MTDEEFEKVQKLYLDECDRRNEIKLKTEQVNHINKKLALLENDDYRIYNVQITFNSSYEYDNDCDKHCVAIDDKNLLKKVLCAYRDGVQKRIYELSSDEVSNEQERN